MAAMDKDIAALGRMTPAQLRAKYLEVFGDPDGESMKLMARDMTSDGYNFLTSRRAARASRALHFSDSDSFSRTGLRSSGGTEQDANRSN